MGKTVKTIVGAVASVGLIVAGVITMNPQLIMAGISIGISTLSMAMAKGPKTSKSATDRLSASIDPRTSRKGAFGDTALNTDIRDQEYTGADKEYFHRFIVTASHKLNSYREIWFDDKLAWTAAGGVQGEFAGYLQVTTRLEGTPANAINISNRMGNTRRFTGCAYVHLRYKLTGNNKKTESPFAQSVPTRITIIGEGMPVYDPRYDSTVPGGNGPARADDQTTWQYSYFGSNSGRNPACQMATYLLGWRIQNPATGAWKLAVGKGTPSNRIDWPSFITAANLCGEPVTLAAGGTEPRYRSDGVFSEFDQATDVLDNLKATMNAELDDMDGLIRVTVLHNDLAVPVLHITDDDLLGDYTWTPHASLEASRNVVRGSYVDPSPKSLYQMVPYPDVAIPSPDGIERPEPINYAFVQSPSQAQRLSKQKLQRAQYAGLFVAEFKSRLWKAAKNDVVTFTCGQTGFVAKLFRVVDTATQVNGVVPVTLREEHPNIYLWDADERPAVQAVDSVPYTNFDLPVSQFLDTVETGANVTENHTSANTEAVGDRTAAAVNYDLDNLYAVGGSILYDISQILLDVDALEATYGSTASAASSATAAAGYASTATTAATNAATAATQAQTARDQAQAARTLAETAKTSAETAQAAAVASASAASGSATAAAGSATTASSHKNAAAGSATAAAGSATAASTSAGNASTSASNASTSAGQAATSATNAAGSASSAATSATTAATARDQAQNSATAAATSASTAGTSATNAGTSASAAQTSANTATTQAGNASTSAGQAATSATNAAGSASAASSSAALAAAAGTAAQNIAISLLPERFVSATHWTAASVNGSPETRPDMPLSGAGWTLAFVTNDPDFGYAAAQTGAGNITMYAKGLLPVVAGRKYEVTYKGRSNISGVVIRADYSALNEAFTNLGTVGAGAGGGGAAASVAGVPWTSTRVIDCDVVLAATPTAKHLRLSALPNRNPTGDAATTVALGLFSVRDVTAREAAAGSATAAASSASSAAASQTAAGNHASAAQSSATSAATQAGNAATSAGNANTSATQAATSATNAAGSASTASTQATNAANSATAAGGSASAAAGSASSAATSATAAGNSASAAQGWSVSASSSSAAAGVSLSKTFPERLDATGSNFTSQLYYDEANAPSLPAAQIVATDGVFAYRATGAYDLFQTKGRLPLVAGRVYELEAEFKLVARSSAVGDAVLATLFLLYHDSGANYLGWGPINWVWGSSGKAVGATYVIKQRLSDVANAARSVAAWNAPAATLWLRPGATWTVQAGTAEIHWKRLTVRDVTAAVAAEGQAATAAGSATAAAASASQASTSATNAGTAATSATASANTATTQAGNASASATSAGSSASGASTSATNAANSATAASGHANTAATQAGNASTSASSAASSAASASSSAASALQSYTLSAQLSPGLLNANATFQNWEGSPLWPQPWQPSGVAYAKSSRQAGLNGYGYSLEMVAALNEASGIYQYGHYNNLRIQPNASYVFEIDAQLMAGSLAGAGMVAYAISADRNSSAILFYGSLSHLMGGAGTVGKVYRHRQVVKVTQSWADHVDFYLYANGDFASGLAAKTIRFYRAGFRQASDAEALAATEIPALQASVSVQAGAITSLQGRSLAYLQQVVNAGSGTTAFVEMRAEVAPGSVTSSVSIGAREVHIYTAAGGGAWKRTLSISGNDVLIDGNLTASAGIFLGSGVLWRLSPAPREFQISDGVAVPFGLNLGAVPLFTFKGDNLAPLSTGETYKLYADLATGSGFTPRLRIVTPGTTTAYNLTVDTVPGTGPTRQIDKGANPDSANNIYRVRFQGTFTGSAYFVDEGGGGGGGGWGGGGRNPIP